MTFYERTEIRHFISEIRTQNEKDAIDVYTFSKGLCVRIKVIHPKYYKHLKKGAQQSHLGRQKVGWFLAD